MMAVFKRNYFLCKDGATSLEFALVVNLLVVSVVGIFGAMSFFGIKADLRKSMIEAERYALIHLEDDNELQALMSGNLSNYDAQNLSFSFSRATGSGVDFVKVNVSYSVNLIFGNFQVSEKRIFPT